MTASAVRRDSQHGERVVYDGIAFELLSDVDAIEVPRSEVGHGRILSSVLCSVTTDLPPAGHIDATCEWNHDRASIRAPGVIACLRHLAPRRYAVTAHVAGDLRPLLEAVARAIRTRDV
jgi:hypothetical protein